MTEVKYRNGSGLFVKLFCWIIFFAYAYYAGKYWFSLLNVGVGMLTVINVLLLIAIPIVGFFFFLLAIMSLVAKYK